MNLFKPAFKIGAFVMLMWGPTMLVPLLVTHNSRVESRSFIYGAACCFLLALALYRLGRGNLQHRQPRAIIMVLPSLKIGGMRLFRRLKYFVPVVISSRDYWLW